MPFISKDEHDNHPKLMERNDSGESESNEDIIYIYNIYIYL